MKYAMKFELIQLAGQVVIWQGKSSGSWLITDLLI